MNEVINSDFLIETQSFFSRLASRQEQTEKIWQVPSLLTVSARPLMPNTPALPIPQACSPEALAASKGILCVYKHMVM